MARGAARWSCFAVWGGGGSVSLFVAFAVPPLVNRPWEGGLGVGDFLVTHSCCWLNLHD